MNRLWVRLSLIFIVIILIGASAILGIGILVERANALEQPVFGSITAPNGAVERLAGYYQQNGSSWKGVELFLSGIEAALPPLGLRLALEDTKTGARHTPPAPTPQDQLADTQTSQPELLQAYPIKVNGTVVGTFRIELTNGAPPIDQMRMGGPGGPIDTPQAIFLARLRDMLLVLGVIVLVVCIPIAVLVSRSVTAPLTRLATAAQAIGARQLQERVKVKGTHEVAALSSAFNEMAEALEQTETMRRNMVADVAHELRTPLTVLQGNLLAILDGVYPLDKNEIGRLYNQTHLLSRLVNDLHELSLADAHALRLHCQPTDVGKLLNGIASAFAPTAEAVFVRVDLHVPQLLPTLNLDPLRITQVLDNLLSNSLRYTPAGGVISIRAEPLLDELVITVHDTGEGIPPEHLPHVFDRFYRTDKTRSRAKGGAGLGLTIARAITETHGGSIEVSSDGILGHGTTFTIRLPLHPTLGQ